MLKAIYDAICGLGDALATGLDFLGGFIADLVEMASMLAEGLATIPEWLGYFFPEELVLILIGVFAIVVIYKLLGREG